MTEPKRKTTTTRKPAARKPVTRKRTPTKKHESYLELLIRTQDRLKKAVFDPGTSPRDLASLTKRLMDTSKEIEQQTAREHDARLPVNGDDHDGEFEPEAI